jgi:hypothetical protein
VADHRAITAVCHSIIKLLETRSQSVDFNSQLQFKVYLAGDFAEKPITAGVSLFLYRIFINTAYRNPPGRIRHPGQRDKIQLPLDLHFLLTAWGPDATLQHSIAGWMMRTLADRPILATHELDAEASNSFNRDEAVEIVIGELDNEMMIRIWDMLLDTKYQLSVPYVARNVHIDSSETISEGLPVQDRIFEYHNA